MDAAAVREASIRAVPSVLRQQRMLEALDVKLNKQVDRLDERLERRAREKRRARLQEIGQSHSSGMAMQAHGGGGGGPPPGGVPTRQRSPERGERRHSRRGSAEERELRESLKQ